MGLSLPDYSYPRLRAFSVCGFIEGREGPSASIERETRLSGYSEPVWLRLKVNSQDGGTHFHIDTCREADFDEGELPEENSPYAEICELIETYNGLEIVATPKAVLHIDLESLPKDGVVLLLSRVMLGPPEDGIRLCGGTVSVEKGPIDTINWRLCDIDGKEAASVLISSKFKGRLGTEYLQQCYAPLVEAFDTLILEERVS